MLKINTQHQAQPTNKSYMGCCMVITVCTQVYVNKYNPFHANRPTRQHQPLFLSYSARHQLTIQHHDYASCTMPRLVWNVSRNGGWHWPSWVNRSG